MSTQTAKSDRRQATLLSYETNKSFHFSKKKRNTLCSFIKDHEVFSRRIPQNILPHISIRSSLIDDRELISCIKTTMTSLFQKIISFSITEEIFSYRNTRPALTADNEVFSCKIFIEENGIFSRRRDELFTEQTLRSRTKIYLLEQKTHRILQFVSVSP